MIRIVSAAMLLLCMAQSALAWDQQPNRYRVSIDADARRAQVEADVWLDGHVLALFNVTPVAGLPNGQAEFLENIQVFDLQGRRLPLANKGEGDFEVAGNQRLRLRYEVRLEHDKHVWPGGVEEVLYHTKEGLLATGYALFLVPAEKMQGRTRVEFRLPPGWQASTPWAATDGGFVAETRRELVNNVIFLGSARTMQLDAGGVTLSLVLGERYWAQRAVITELLERQLKSYLDLFGAPPLAARYLIVINQGDSGDGGAFAGSFSQFLRGDADPATLPIWGRVVAHELLHFWNGVSMVPVDGRDEWFKEGVTDYLTLMTMARNGYLERAFLIGYLENLSRGQMVARRAQGLTMSIREAAIDKHKNWLLVYGGGSIAALALDVELRSKSGGKQGLPELMQAMYAEFAKPGKAYTLEDIVRVARQRTGQDIGPLLQRIVADPAPSDLAPMFAGIGLQLEQYMLLEHYLLPNQVATPEQRARFAHIFGALR